MFNALFRTIAIIGAIIGIAYLLGFVWANLLYCIGWVLIIVLEVFYWVIQTEFKNKRNRILGGIVAVEVLIIYTPLFNFVENWLDDYKRYSKHTYFVDYDTKGSILKDKDMAVYFFDTDSIEKLAGKKIGTFSGTFFGPYKAGMSPYRFNKKRHKKPEEKKRVDRRYFQSGMFNKKEELFGLIDDKMRGPDVHDERITSNVDDLCNFLGDSLSAFLGQPYFSYSFENERLRAWTGDGLIHAVYVVDDFDSYRSYTHHAEAIVYTYQPEFMREAYEELVNDNFYEPKPTAIVDLAFNGIHLGGPLYSQIDDAIKRGVIQRSQFIKERDMDLSEINTSYSTVLSKTEEVEISVKIYGFEDQVYRIELSSNSYGDALKDAFVEKYGDNTNFKNEHIYIGTNRVEYVHDSLDYVVSKKQDLKIRAVRREYDEAQRQKEKKREEEHKRRLAEQQI